MTGPPSGSELNVDLLAGFHYACRPDCGLCCYAEPRVLADDRTRLLRIEPEATFVRNGGYQFLAGRPDGGACQLLDGTRCRAHDGRPHPCREFPVSVHIGTRLQATIVLSCPGVELAPLREPSARRRGTPVGFEEEITAVRHRLDDTVPRRLDGTRRRRQRLERRLRRDGRWEDEEAVREKLLGSIPLPSDADFPVPDPPGEEDGLEHLPLFFDGRGGPVALSAGLGGWALQELSPAGGVVRTLGVVPPPARAPALSSEAAALLRGYLQYWLDRDAFFGAVHLAMLEEPSGTVSEWASEELAAIGAQTVARAMVRAKLERGEVDRLTDADLAKGIRAIDQDLLDRDSWGERL